MDQIIPLKCPNCSASISPETTRCGYCGSYVCFQNNLPTLRDRARCSECGAMIGEGSLVCAKCGKILTNDQNEIESLKEIQKRLVFLQQKFKEQFSDIVRQGIGEDEYIFFYEKLASNCEMVVTDKRYFYYAPPGPNPESLRNIPYEQIVDIGPITRLPDWVNRVILGRIGTILYQVDLTTYEKSQPVMVSDAAGFHKAIKSAFEGHIHKGKNINAILCSLKL